MENVEVKVVNIGDIDYSEKLNSRPINPEHVNEMYKLLKRDGLQQRPVVRPKAGKGNEGKYEAVIGFHRLTAAAKLGWTTIPVDVREMDDITAATVNVVDGLSHRALSTYEMADAAVNLAKRFKLEDKDVAKRLNLSLKYVQQMIRSRTKLAPKIAEEWKKGNGLCTKNNLEVWAALPQHEQLDKWNEATGDKPVGGTTGGATGATATAGAAAKAKPKKSLKYDVLAMAHKEAKKRLADGTDTPQESVWLRAVVEALSFAMGEKKEIQGVFKLEEAKPEKLAKEALEAIQAGKGDELKAAVGGKVQAQA